MVSRKEGLQKPTRWHFRLALKTGGLGWGRAWPC